MSRRRLLLDARMVGPNLHGIARYVVSLARALQKHSGEWVPTLLLTSDAPAAIREEFTHALSPVGFLDPKEVVALPAIVGQLGPRLLHLTSFSCSPLMTVPFVMTLHDAIHLQRPADYGWKQQAYYRLVVTPAAKRARAIITVSEDARTQLMRYLGLPADNLHVVHNGVEERFLTIPPRPREPFVLTICGPKAHKNTVTLIHALHHAPGVKLVVAGEVLPALQVLSRTLGVADRVTWLGPVGDDVLLDHLARAQVFAFPSLLEGFGLPVLEAMAAGCPAVVSDIPVFHEVGAELSLIHI